MSKLSTLYHKIQFCRRFGATSKDSRKLIQLTLNYMMAIRSKVKRYRMQSDQSVHQIDAVFNDRCFPLHFRMQDISMLYEVWMDQSYEIKEKEVVDGTVVDLGAHVGFTTLYYWTLLGDDRNYVCIEGSNKNAEVLKVNVAPITNCKVHQQIITADGRQVKFYDEVSGHLHQVHDTKGTVHQSVSVQSLLADENSIALCKIDIEGMESEILTTHNEWLSKVDMIALELHDSPGNTALKSNMQNEGYDWKEVNGIVHLNRKGVEQT